MWAAFKQSFQTFLQTLFDSVELLIYVGGSDSWDNQKRYNGWINVPQYLLDKMADVLEPSACCHHWCVTLLCDSSSIFLLFRSLTGIWQSKLCFRSLAWYDSSPLFPYSSHSSLLFYSISIFLLLLHSIFISYLLLSIPFVNPRALFLRRLSPARVSCSDRAIGQSMRSCVVWSRVGHPGSVLQMATKAANGTATLSPARPPFRKQPSSGESSSFIRQLQMCIGYECRFLWPHYT